MIHLSFVTCMAMSSSVQLALAPPPPCLLFPLQAAGGGGGGGGVGGGGGGVGLDNGKLHTILPVCHSSFPKRDGRDDSK